MAGGRILYPKNSSPALYFYGSTKSYKNRRGIFPDVNKRSSEIRMQDKKWLDNRYLSPLFGDYLLQAYLDKIIIAFYVLFKKLNLIFSHKKLILWGDVLASF